MIVPFSHPSSIYVYHVLSCHVQQERWLHTVDACNILHQFFKRWQTYHIIKKGLQDVSTILLVILPLFIGFLPSASPRSSRGTKPPFSREAARRWWVRSWMTWRTSTCKAWRSQPGPPWERERSWGYGDHFSWDSWGSYRSQLLGYPTTRYWGVSPDRPFSYRGSPIKKETLIWVNEQFRLGHFQ